MTELFMKIDSSSDGEINWVSFFFPGSHAPVLLRNQILLLLLTVVIDREGVILLGPRLLT